MGRTLHPVFLDLKDRRVLLVGGGLVAVEKARALADAGASLVVVAPDVRPELLDLASTIFRRPFQSSDVDDVWYVVAAAPPEVNAEVRRAADARRVFINAVDDRDRATAFAASVLRRGPVTVAIGTGGDAPALSKLLRQALDRLLPTDLQQWASIAGNLRQRWLRDQTPMAARTPELLATLADLHQQEKARAKSTPVVAPSPALVSLVGAGPGHPDLLTRRGAQRLAEADLVLYDALVVSEMLALAPRAQCVLVGRRKGRPTLSQDGIHRVMIAAARRGRRVVRLKGGDPFVFGRGGEEALALANAGVPFEIVPGVSTAFAAPAAASIPVTHREVSSAVLVISGHDEARFVRQIAGTSPEQLTMVIMMGHSARARLATRLLEHGWSTSLPAAIVSGASRSDGDVRSTTLGGLAREDPSQDPQDQPPATLVIGEVTRVRDELLHLVNSRSADSVALEAGAALEPEGADRAEVCHG